MSVLKVTKVDAMENPVHAEVEVGQVRMTESGAVVMVIKAPNALRPRSKEQFSLVLLDNGSYPFEINNELSADTAKYIVEQFPILLDAELTYKEAK